MTRKVTEADFRLPQYRDANPEDYEFRDDGAIVRKDRWEKAVREIASMLDVNTREGFECDNIVFSIGILIEKARRAGVHICYYDEIPK